MKETKYILNGRTHRNGITAISWVNWLVIDNSNTEAQAASAIQRNLRNGVGDPSLLSSEAGEEFAIIPSS